MSSARWPIAAWLWLAAASASSHPLDPGLLVLEEHDAAAGFAVRFVPPRAEPGLRPRWPSACRFVPGPDSGAGELACGALPLAGLTIGVDGFGGGGAAVLARVRFADGRSLVSWLDARTPSLVVPPRSTRLALVAEHVRLGFAHLAGGLDHALFVAGLVVLVRRGRALWLAVTAFTLGHSVTLACAVLGVVRVPGAVVEPAIAATLVALAYEIAQRSERRADESAALRRPLLLPCAFGLLHGLGFASALDWLGVARGDLPLALAGFNLGIEAGQLALVAALVFAGAALARTTLASWPRASLAPAYAIGTLGVYWLLVRLAAIPMAL